MSTCEISPRRGFRSLGSRAPASDPFGCPLNVKGFKFCCATRVTHDPEQA